jgi:CTP:molybdopterin cytidylyltransferase MocA
VIKVSALLLAAGSGRRMGRLKQLLPLADKPVFRHCLDSLVASGITDIVTVLGQESAGISEAVGTAGSKIVLNDIAGSDMAESVRTGLHEIDPSSSGVMVCLADHPLVSVGTYKSLITAHRNEPEKILVPVYHGRRGHPTLFPAAVIREIFREPHLRSIIGKNPGRLRFMGVADEGVILDMDTAEDYRLIREKLEGAA